MTGRREQLTMAEKKTQEVQQPVEEVYEAAEIAKNAPRLFGYSVDIAKAALDFAGITSCTLTKAKEVIKAFAERKVK